MKEPMMRSHFYW